MTYEWTIDDQPVTDEMVEGYCGFVYEITNLTNNRKYIGKKLLTKTKRKVTKGKSKKIQVTSDWRDYYGSNKELQEDVKTLGNQNFSRKILRLCKTKGECSYFEAKYQFDRDVLLSENYYNKWIFCRILDTHLRRKK